MAKLGYRVTASQAQARLSLPSSVAPDDTDALEDEKAVRQRSNIAPASLALAKETVESTRDQARQQMAVLEGVGLGDSDEFRRAQQIADEGGVDPKGKVGKLLGWLDWLDRPGHVVRLAVADVLQQDRKKDSEEIGGADYLAALRGDYESIASRHQNLVGEDGRLVGGEILDAAGWETEKGETSWYNNALHGLTGFALDVAGDPLTYVTGGASAALKKTILKGANESIEKGLTRGLGRAIGGKGVVSSRGGTEAVANEAQKRIKARLDDLFAHATAEGGEMSDVLRRDLTQQAKDEIHDEMLSEVMQPLAKKRFDQLPDWFADDTDVVGDWLKGGLRLGVGSRNTYGRGAILRGANPRARQAIVDLGRRSEKLSAGFDRLARIRGKVTGALNTMDPVIQGAKMGYEFAPQAVRLMAQATADGFTARTRGLVNESIGAMAKLADGMKNASDADMGTTFQTIFRWTNNGDMIQLADELPEHLRGVAEEFANSWTTIMRQMREIAASPEVGLLSPEQAIGNYTPTVLSREFIELAKRTLDTGIETWDDNAPEEIKQGLALLNEVFQGLHRRMGSDRTVAGATAYANERTLGRGVAVQEMSGSFLFHYNQVEDGVPRVATQYASHMEMNDAMMQALEYIVTKHNAIYHADPLRKITVPKWMSDAVDSPSTASHGVLELDPAKVLQGYVNSMSQAVNERRIAHLAQQIGLLSKTPGKLDSARISYAIHEQLGDRLGSSQRRIAAKLEKMYNQRETATQLAERTVDRAKLRMTRVKIGDLEIEVPREALDDPKVVKAIEKAKAAEKVAREQNRTRERTLAARKRRLVNQGVSEDLAEQAAATTGNEIWELWRTIQETQVREMEEQMAALIAVRQRADDAFYDDAGRAEGRVAQQAIAEAEQKMLRIQQELAATRISLEKQWKKNRSRPVRITFESLSDRSFMLETFRRSLGDKLAAIAERLPEKHVDELLEIADLIRQGKWGAYEETIEGRTFKLSGARVRLETWWKTYDGDAFAVDQAAKIKKQHYNRKRTAFNQWVRENGGDVKFSMKRWNELKNKLDTMHGDLGEVPEGYRDLYEKMNEIAAAEAEHLSDTMRAVQGETDAVGSMVAEFGEILDFFRKLEAGETIGASKSTERKRFIKWARESGFLQSGQVIEWEVPGTPYGIRIRDMRDYNLPSLEAVEKELRALGYRSMDNARRIVDIANMSDRAWFALNAQQMQDWGLDDKWVKAVMEGADLSAEALEKSKSGGWETLRNSWGNRASAYEVLQEWVDEESGLVFRWERDSWQGEVAGEAIAVRTRDGELLGFIMDMSGGRQLEARDADRLAIPHANPRTLGAETILNGSVVIAASPQARGITVNGIPVVAQMRRYAELVEMPTVVGSGETGYYIPGMVSAWKNAKAEAARMSEGTREALIRYTDDRTLARVSEASVNLRESVRAVAATRKEFADGLSWAVKWDKFRQGVDELQDLMAKKHPDIALIRKKAKELRKLQLRYSGQGRNGIAVGIGPEASVEIEKFIDHVDYFLGLQDVKTAWLANRAQETIALREGYFDTEKAKKNIEAMLRTRENKMLDASMEAWDEALEGTELLAQRIAQILGYTNAAQGDFVKYHTEEQATELLNMVEDARRLWAEYIGDANPFEGIRSQAYTPTAEAPGWLATDAVKLGGEGITGFGGDAQAMKFLENFIGKHAALGTPRGLEEFTNATQRLINAWKTYATVMRMPFHVRNFVSAAWANQLADVRPSNYAGSLQLFKGGKESFFWRLMVRGEGIESALEAVADPQLKKAARAFYDEGGFFETYAEQEIARRTIRKLGAGGATRAQKAAEAAGGIIGPHGMIARGGGHTMQGVESFHRFAAFLRMYGIDGDAGSAMSWVHTIHFDYSDLTSFERNVIRKYVPFYVWAKNNIPLQLRMAVERPGIINRYGHLIREAENAWGNDEEQLPSSPWRTSPMAKVGRFDGAPDDFYSQIIWSPDIPVADLYELGGTGPSGVLVYLLNSLGPQFEPLTAASEDYKVDASGSLQSVITALGGASPTGLNRVDPMMRALWGTALPTMADWVDPLVERSPARLERLGQSGGVEGSDFFDSIARGLRKNVLGGLGFSFEGSEAGYRAATGGAFELQDDLYNLRKQGYIPAEMEEKLKQAYDASQG